MSERLFKRGGIYYGWYYLPGGRIRKRSTTCKDKRAALAALHRWEQQAQGAGGAEGCPHTLDDALNHFVDHATARNRPDRVRRIAEQMVIRDARLLVASFQSGRIVARGI